MDVRFDGREDHPQVSGFQSERPVWIVSRKEMVEDRLSITSTSPSLPFSLSPSLSHSTWRFLPWRNGCTDSVAEIRFEDPFSSGINVTGRCSWRWKFRPVGSWTFVYFKPGGREEDYGGHADRGGGEVTRPSFVFRIRASVLAGNIRVPQQSDNG